VSARDIAAAYALARDVFSLRKTWKEIEQSTHLAVATQVDMFAKIAHFLESATRWILRNLPLPLDIERAFAEIMPGVSEIEKSARQLHSTTTRENAQTIFTQLKEQSVSENLADKISQLEMLASAFDIIAISHRTGRPVSHIGKIYFELGTRIKMGWLRLAANRITTTSHWERLAVQSLTGDLYDEQRRLTIAVIETTTSLENWEHTHTGNLTRYDRFIESLGSTDTPDIPKLMVALQHVRSL